MSLVSVSTLKNYLPEIGSASGADTELQNLLNRVESAVARFLGFPSPSGSSSAVQLESATYTLYFDSYSYNDNKILQMNIKPINSLTSIHVDVDRVYGSSTALTISNIDIDAVNGRLIIRPNKSDMFERGFRAIKVVCNAGFSDAPDDLEHAICVWASQLHRAKQNQGKENISQQGNSLRLSPKTIPEEVKQLLYPFRTPLTVL